MVKACAKALKPLTTIYSREENSIIRRLRNKYSSLLFRDLISTLCGIIWKESPTSQGGLLACIVYDYDNLRPPERNIVEDTG